MGWIDSSEFAGFRSSWFKSTATHERFGSVYCNSHKEIGGVMLCLCSGYCFKHLTVYAYAFIFLMKQFCSAHDFVHDCRPF